MDTEKTTTEPGRNAEVTRCSECGTEVEGFAAICPACDGLLIDEDKTRHHRKATDGWDPSRKSEQDPLVEWLERNEISLLGTFVGFMIIVIGFIWMFFINPPDMIPAFGPGVSHREHIISIFVIIFRPLAISTGFFLAALAAAKILS